MTGSVQCTFVGGGGLEGARSQRRLRDGNLPEFVRVLTAGEPPASAGAHDDGVVREWDVYRRSPDDVDGVPQFEFVGQERTGGSS